MDIFSVITLFGGLAFFLYGMNVMSDGLEKSAGGKLESSLTKVTNNRFTAIFFGAVLTVAVQSSSAVTVMLVGLVNSGILEFSQTLGVMMGSNIGTTLTAWILSLSGITSDSFWIKLLKPENFSLIFALIGIIMTMMCKQQKKKSIGAVLIGFAVLMFGMNLMSGAMEPLGEMPEFKKILTAFKNPILGVVVGTVFTGIIQSSAASVAILQALSMTGGITYGMAIPIIMGQNIGTCVTALLSSIGVNKNAKRVAVAHITIKTMGMLVCLIPFCAGDLIFNWAFTDKYINPFMIAVVHSAFNIITTIIFVPFLKQIDKLIRRMVPDKENKTAEEVILDERLLTIPSMAVKRSFDTATEMCRAAINSISNAIGLISKYDQKEADIINERESYIDKLEDKLGTYMMKLSKIGLSESDSKDVTKVLHTIDDFERIGDHAVNLVDVAKELHDKKISFSKEASDELEVLFGAISEILKLTSESFVNSDYVLATSVEPLEQVIDKLILKIKHNHIDRLQSGVCTIELGFILSDLLTSCERVSDHCSNVAVAVIETHDGTFDTHEYLSAFKDKENDVFMNKYREYKKRFKIEKTESEIKS